MLSVHRHWQLTATGNRSPAGASHRSAPPSPVRRMDLWYAAAAALLLVWAGLTFGTVAPGWVQGLLTAGVFLVIYRVVQRGTTPRG